MVWVHCVSLIVLCSCLQGMETQCPCLSGRFVFPVFRVWRHSACVCLIVSCSLSSGYGHTVPVSLWSFCVPCLQGMETQCLCLSNRYVFPVFVVWTHSACVSLVVLCSLSSGYGETVPVSLIILCSLSSGYGDSARVSDYFVFPVFGVWTHSACVCLVVLCSCLHGMETQCPCLSGCFVFPVFRVWRHSACVSLVVLCSLSSGYGDTVPVPLIISCSLSSEYGDRVPVSL